MKPLPELSKKILEQMLGHFHSVREPELQEQAKAAVFGILDRYSQLKYDVRKYVEEAKKVFSGLTAIALTSLLPYNAYATIPAQYENGRQTGARVLTAQKFMLDDKVLFYYMQLDRNNDNEPDMEVIVSPCNKDVPYAIADYFMGILLIDRDLDGTKDFDVPISSSTI